jgi:uncharacterized protein YcbX
VHVDRIGFTPLKGGRHLQHDGVELTAEGPVGDRVFCLVDPARARVLRTVENPSLLRCVARWDGKLLSVDLPGGSVEGAPEPSGEDVKVDYWGRPAALEVVDGPWAAAYSRHLGYDVLLARSTRPGEIVYGGSVSLVTTSSLHLLSARAGGPVSGVRFRPTFVIDTNGLDPHVEDSWAGRELRLGDARVRIRGVIPRCAVVDLDPVTGSRDVPVLETLGGYRRGRGEIDFGVDGVVTEPGRVHPGDTAELGRD